MSDRLPLDERSIEYDGLAIVLLAAAFLICGAGIASILSLATQTFDAGIVAAAGVVALAVLAAWIFGYPRRAAIPAIALVLLCAMEFLPVIFSMDGALMREAAGSPASRVYVVKGLYVGGLGVALLALLVFGFFCPLAGAVLGLRRREAKAREVLIVHALLTGGALALTLFPRLGF